MRTAKKWFVVAVSALVMVGCGGGVGEVGSSPRAVVVTPTLEGPINGRRLVCTDLDVGLNQLYTDVLSFEGVTFPHVLNFADTDAFPGPLQVELTFASSKKFDWTSNVGVDFVLVGQTLDFSTFVYAYAPEATAGENVVAPEDQDILYVKFCYDPDEDHGCTLTQGFWKTHSSMGPAAAKDFALAAWAELGEDAEFFDSGMTNLQVIQSPSKGGNAFFILGRQYVAAVLNGISGASTTAVAGDLADAAALFDGLAEGVTTFDDADRAEAIRLAGILADYNEGELGPGHCE